MFRALINSVAWSVPTLLAAVFGAAEVLSRLYPQAVLKGVPAVLAAAVALATWGAYVTARRRGRREAASLATTAALLVPAAFGCYLVTETPFLRAAFAAAAVLLLSFYLAYLRGIVRQDPRFTPLDFSHLSLSVHAVTVFFAWYALASLPDYVDLPLAATAAAMTLLAVVTASETLRRAGMRPGRALQVGGAMSLMVAQLFLGLSFLPTSDAAAAAVGTILFVTGMQAAVWQLAAPVPTTATPIRRQLAFSLLLITIVFSTSRWV